MKSPHHDKATKAWLAQFTPVDDAALTDSQADFIKRIRAQFPKAKVGRKADGQLDFYLIDKETGPFNGSFPPWDSTGNSPPVPGAK